MVGSRRAGPGFADDGGFAEGGAWVRGRWWVRGGRGLGSRTTSHGPAAVRLDARATWRSPVSGGRGDAQTRRARCCVRRCADDIPRARLGRPARRPPGTQVCAEGRCGRLRREPDRRRPSGRASAVRICLLGHVVFGPIQPRRFRWWCCCDLTGDLIARRLEHVVRDMSVRTCSAPRRPGGALCMRGGISHPANHPMIWAPPAAIPAASTVSVPCCERALSSFIHSSRSSSWASPVVKCSCGRCAPRGPVRGRLSAPPTASSFSESRGAGGPAGGPAESSTSHVAVTTPDSDRVRPV
jgi:hypothetical protein